MNTAPHTTMETTSEGHSRNSSMIVPVRFSSVNKPNIEQVVYALLDTQSDSTFTDKEVVNDLQTDRHPVKLKLTTMLGENMIVESERVSGCRVRGYNSPVHIDLPHIDTRDYIPANRSHIPTHETAKQWPHLREITGQMPPILS